MKTQLLKNLSCLFVLAILLISAQAQAERTTTYMHSDALGSVIAASDEEGNLLWRKQYQPFGAQIEGGNESEEVSYTGKKFNKKTGLSYYGARHYDPFSGRFVSVDPVGALEATESNTMMFNRYAYANNNPYLYRDADGGSPSPMDIFFFAKDVGSLFVAEIAYAAAVVVDNPAVARLALEDMRSLRGDAFASTIGLVNPVPGTSQAYKASKIVDKAGDAAKGVDANTLQRTHSLSTKRQAKDVDAIADSMRKDGFVGDGIDVVEHNGQRFIIDGHHRAAAARRTGTPVNVNVVNDIKGHRSNFNNIGDVLDSAGSVGPDRLKPRGRR